MKIEFKQSFVEEEKEFKVKYKGKAGEAEVPAHFVFLATFFSLLKAGLIKILSFKEDEFSEVEEKHFKNLSEEDQQFLQGVLESAMMKEEESDEDEGSEDDKEPSTTSDSSDSSVESSQGSEESQTQTSGQELSQNQDADKKDDSEELKKEYDLLHEKAKRLNKDEKKRYAELKAVLKIEE